MTSRSVHKMASSLAVVKSMHKQLLGCAVCHGRYIRPKLLPCFHSFCEACLGGYVPANSLSMACPVCRHPSILPREGVTALTDNVFITTVMEAVESSNICNVCHKVGWEDPIFAMFATRLVQKTLYLQCVPQGRFGRPLC